MQIKKAIIISRFIPFLLIINLFWIFNLNISNNQSLNYEFKDKFLFKINSDTFCKEIMVYVNQKLMGYIKSINCLRWAVLYDFYIFPENRRKGYGKILLEYMCATLKNNGVKYIFIQPGPFELENENTILNDNLIQDKINKLIKLYCSSGFVPAKKWLKYLASIFYEVTNIQENSQYLMIHSVTD